MKSAVIRRVDNTITVSEDGVAPLTEKVVETLTAGMIYTHISFVRGFAAVDRITGDRHPVRSEPVRLYEFDSKGRLNCGAGYIDRVYSILMRAGYEVAFVDRTKLTEREDARVAQWKRLEKYPEFRKPPGDRAWLYEAQQEDGPDPDLARRVIQREALEQMARRIEKRLGGIVDAPPGFGKSYNFAALVAMYPHARFVITAPDIGNCKKTARHLTGYTPNVGMVGGGSHEIKRVTVCTADSLHHLANHEHDIFLCDEAHAYMSPDRMEKLAAVTRFGVNFAFSGSTEGRMDGADKKIEFFFGPRVFYISWQDATALGLIVPIEVKWLRISEGPNVRDVPKGVYDPDAWRKRVGIWENSYRNKRIVAGINTISADDQVLVMVETIAHAVRLQNLLPDFRMCYGSHDADAFKRYVRSGLIDADFEPVSPKIREDMRLDFESGDLKRVIATDVWSTGVSFDALSHLWRADARQSKNLSAQIPGRVSRIHEASEKAVGKLYDCDDVWDQGFGRGAKVRGKAYGEFGWQQSMFGT